MLTQEEADYLITLDKQFFDTGQSISFPQPGQTITASLESLDGRERFQLDIESGNLVRRWKLQLRYRSVEILVRLDMGGPAHMNPDNAPTRSLSAYAGKRIETPHIQRYVEGYNDRWALPLPSQFAPIDDIDVIWREFLKYCNIIVIPALQGRLT